MAGPQPCSLSLRLALALALACLAPLVLAGRQQADRPNIVLILTDDQDYTLGGAEPLAEGARLVKDQGVEFTNAFVTTPICCPSRSSILTGRYLHNTGVWNNSASGGCSGPEWRQGLEQETYGALLKKAGYRTMYSGKYLNQYGVPEGGGVDHIPPGWDSWAGLVGNSKYYNYTLSIDGKAEKHGDDYAEDYLTDVIRRHALQFLGSVANSSEPPQPFLMVLATPASHAPFTPAPQYKDSFRDKKAPRTPAFNRDQPSDPEKHWLMETEPKKMSDQTVDLVDEVFRDRWRTLLSVDDIFTDVHGALETYGMLENTYILFTSDHGYHLGQFGFPWDKRLPYEFDIRIPFWISGPNIAAKQKVATPVLSIDIAPTLLDLAGAPRVPEMDGLSFLPLVMDPPPGHREEKTRIAAREAFLVEYSGEGIEKSNSPECSNALNGDLASYSTCKIEVDCKCQDTRNNTFHCIRTLGQEEVIFCQFEDDAGFLELYSLSQDQFQLNNLAKELTEETLEYYKRGLGALAQCKGAQCNNVGALQVDHTES